MNILTFILLVLVVIAIFILILLKMANDADLKKYEIEKEVALKIAKECDDATERLKGNGKTKK